jgi:uncharacterized glyoxalase superfamily protein PhnB
MHMKGNVKAIPDGYPAVAPYLVARGVPRLIEFLEEAFGAVEIGRHTQPDGRVMHAEVRIRDSVLMMGEASEQWPPVACNLHLYVEDVDAVFQKAVKAGGTVIREVADQFYGDRSGGVTDPVGNMWWISTHVEDVSREEMERRQQAMKA